jgi:hypothetical protein
MANAGGLYEYGIVPVGKFGGGSFYAPYNTNRQKALTIQPVNAGNFEIADGQDFYISAWIKYGTINVSQDQLGVEYPIIKYGVAHSYYPGIGWEFGITITRFGAIPYFSFNNNGLVKLQYNFNGTNGNLVNPTGDFDHWEVSRINGVITFKFNGNFSSDSTTIYSGAIAHPLQEEIDLGYIDPSFASIYVGSEQPYVINQDNGAYIDELFFARGVGQVINYNEFNNSINDGKESTTVFLYHFDGNYIDTITQNLYTTASIQSSTIIDIEPTYLKAPNTAEVELFSTSTLNAHATLSYPDHRPLSVSRLGTLANYDNYMYFTSTSKVYGQSLHLPGNNSNTAGGYLRVGSDTLPTSFNSIASGQDFYISFWTDNLDTYVETTPISLIQSGGSYWDGSHSIYQGWVIGLSNPGNVWPTAYFSYEGKTITIYRQYVQLGSGPTQWIIKRENNVITFQVGGYSATQTDASYISGGATYIGLGSIHTAQPWLVDEVFFAVGVSAVQNYTPNGEIADGSLSTTKLLLHFNGDYLDDTSGIFNLPSTQLTSTSSIVIDTAEYINFAANLTSTSTQTTNINKFKLFNASLTSTSTLIETINTVKRASATLHALSSELIVIGKKQNDVADLIARSTLTANVQRTKISAPIILLSNSSLTEITSRTRNSNAGVSSTSTITATSTINKQFSANLSVTSTMRAGEFKGVNAVVNLTSTSTLAEITTRTRNLQARLQALSSELIVGQETRVIEAHLSSTSSLVCRIGINAQLSSTSNITIVPNVTRNIQEHLTNYTSLVALAGKQVVNSSNLNSYFTIHASVSKSRIDTSLVWYIPYEERGFQIEYEERGWVIPDEV